jgi:hypothetical protein
MQNQTRNLVIVALVAALVAVTCLNQSPGQVAAAKPAAVKWEYKFATCPKLEQSPDGLNKLGADGWELCISQSLGSEGEFYALVLKRPFAGK